MGEGSSISGNVPDPSRRSCSWCGRESSAENMDVLDERVSVCTRCLDVLDE